MSTVPTIPRVQAGVREGGQFTAWARPEADVSLLGVSDRLRARHEDLLAEGFVPAVALPARDDPSSTRGRDRWWADHFVTGEYRADGSGFPQMDDGAGDGSDGRSLAGQRRVPRMRYEGAGVTLRMPAAAAVRRFASDERSTFDVPVSAEVLDEAGRPRTVAGWVRVAKGPAGGWSARGLGFDARDEEVSEAVAAVLEARRPSMSLRQAGDLLARARERATRQGADLVHVDSSWVDAVGYDQTTGLMAMRTKTGALYGHHVSRATFEAVAQAGSPGARFNELVKGHARAAVANCPSCGRFYSQVTGHTCPVTPAAPSATPIEQNLAARRAAVAATSPTPTRRVAATPVRSVEPAPKTIDLARLLADGRRERQAQYGDLGRPGFTQDVAAPLGKYIDSAHVPWAYSEWVRADGSHAEHANGSTGLIYFAGLGGSDAAEVLAALPSRNRRDRQAAAAPTVESVLHAAAATGGKVEALGYVVGPERTDERVSVDGFYLFDALEETPTHALSVARNSYGITLTKAPDEAALVDVPWRPGEKAWRFWWD